MFSQLYDTVYSLVGSPSAAQKPVGRKFLKDVNCRVSVNDVNGMSVVCHDLCILLLLVVSDQ